MGRQSLGRGCSLVGAASPSTENTFPNPTVPGQEDAPLRLLESGDYRSELQSVLQTWLIVGLGELGEQASPPAWTRQGPRASPGAGTSDLEPGALVWLPGSFWLLRET